MAYTEFSTERADYVLQLSSHLRRNDHNVFHGIDALVLETGWRKLEHYLQNSTPQYNMPILYCQLNGIPIFGADCRNTVGGLIRGFISDSIPESPIPIPFFYAFSRNRTDGISERSYSFYTFVLQGPFLEGRNAINARKIEEYITPRVQELLGKDHPKIGLIFGAAHVGLKYDLMSKRRRDFTLWNWRNLNFGRYSGFNTEELDKVYEAHYEGRRWWVTGHRTSLFP